MKKKILILADKNIQEELNQVINYDGLGYDICGVTDDLTQGCNLIVNQSPEIVICDEKTLDFIKNTYPKQYKIVISENDIYNNNFTYNIKLPLTEEKIVSRLYTIDFQIRKQRDKLEHRMIVTEFLLPLILDYNGEYSDEYIHSHVHDSYLIHDYEDPSFCIFSFEILKDGQMIEINNLYLEDIDNILNKYINAYSYIVGKRIISFFVLSHAGRIKNINKSVEEIKTYYEEKNIEISIGKSSVFNKLSSTHLAYITALNSTKMKLKRHHDLHLSISIDELFKDFEKNLVYIIKNESEEQFMNLIEYCFSIPKDEQRKHILNTLIETIYKTTLNVTGVNQFVHLISQELLTQNSHIVLDEEFRKQEFMRLCINARNCIMENRRSDSEGLCDQVIEIINQEYQDENLSLVDISKRLSVSTNYLCALLKKVTGKNYTSIVNEVRMNAAKSMLIDTNLKINEIASRCGYSDQHYFSTCFKKHFGVSPNKVKNKQIKLPI